MLAKISDDLGLPLSATGEAGLHAAIATVRREKHGESMTRGVALMITNAHIGDGDFALEVASVLSAYAEAILRGAAGRESNEEMNLPSGTSLSVSVIF